MCIPLSTSVFTFAHASEGDFLTWLVILKISLDMLNGRRRRFFSRSKSFSWCSCKMQGMSLRVVKIGFALHGCQCRVRQGGARCHCVFVKMWARLSGDACEWKRVGPVSWDVARMHSILFPASSDILRRGIWRNGAASMWHVRLIDRNHW